MPLAISAKLVDSNNKALANQPVEVSFYNLVGRTQKISSGRTDRAGQFKGSSNVSFSQFLPRILLRTRQNNKWISLTNTPKSFSQTRLDFGTVKVSNEPVLSVANSVFHRIPTNFTASNNNELNSRLSTLNTSNNTLKRQLSDEQTKNRQLLTQIEGLQRRPTSNTDDRNRIASLTTENTHLSQLIKTKDLKIKELENNPQTAPALQVEELDSNEVISSALAAINAADSQNNGRFQLKSAKMDLKVLPGSSKDKVRLVKNSDSLRAIKPELFTTLTLDLAAFKPAPSRPADTKTEKMPDLTGYTRSLAVRRLNEMALEATWYKQQLTPDEAPLLGTILSQQPQAGSPLGNDSEIILIIGSMEGGA